MKKKSRKIFTKPERKPVQLSPETHQKLKFYAVEKKTSMESIAEKAILKEIES